MTQGYLTYYYPHPYGVGSIIIGAHGSASRESGNPAGRGTTSAHRPGDRDCGDPAVERRAASGHCSGRAELSSRTRCRAACARLGGAQLSSGHHGAPRRLFFLISIAVPGPLKFEIMVMSNPTISSSSLLSWPRNATLICYRHKQHRHELYIVFLWAVATQGGRGHEF